MAFYSGKNASVTISASARPASNWTLTLKSDPVETTNFTSSGYQENVAGVFSADCSWEGPYDNSEGVSQGDSVSVVFGIGGGGQSFTVTVRVTSVNIKTDVKGVATIAYQGVSNGSFSITP